MEKHQIFCDNADRVFVTLPMNRKKKKIHTYCNDSLDFDRNSDLLVRLYANADVTATNVTMSADPQPSAKKNAPCAGTNSSGASPCFGDVDAVSASSVAMMAVVVTTVASAIVFAAVAVAVVRPTAAEDVPCGRSTRALSPSSGLARCGGGAGCACCCWPLGPSIRFVSSALFSLPVPNKRTFS